jgi:hypothetical protein
MTNTENSSILTEKLLRQAELKKTQIELNIQFKKNMETFKKRSPGIFNAFKNYQPQELRLSLNSDGYVELVNFNLNNKPVYPNDPKVFAKQQMEAFRKKPLLSNVNFSPSTPYNDRHFHLDTTNEILSEYDGNEEPTHKNIDDPIGLMIMTGCGLGYQIEEVMEQLDVYGLCIFDPHKDSFYASLHTVDWEKIFEYFNQSGRMIKLCIGMTPARAMTHLKLLTDEIGLHNVVHTFIYRHFNSQDESSFIELYKKEFHLNSLGIGFFDDEQISLSHTVKNVEAGVPILRNAAIEAHDLPAFIIGNGPSLDKLKEFILDNKDNAALFSCGTSLGSLYKMGIKPDYHVEMERTKTMKAWLEKGTTEEFRKDITIFGLNNIHPDTFGMFDSSFMASKANDLGQRLISSETDNQTFTELNFCNPTVTNCALSYAYNLGFRKFYLIGVDLGMIDQDSHHAKNSVHFELDKTKLADNNYTKNNYTVEGNFVDTVITTPTLDSSRVNFERYISHHKDIKVYNPNNGAKIHGAIPLMPGHLPNLEQLPKLKDEFNSKLSELFSSIDTKNFSEQKIHTKYLKPLYPFRRPLKMEEGLKTYEAIFQEQNRIYAIIRQLENENPVAAILIRGSVSSILGLISKFCQHRNPEEIAERYDFIRSKYQNIIDKAFQSIRTDAFLLDDTLTYWEKNKTQKQ